PVTRSGVPTGPCAGTASSLPTNPPEGSVSATSGPSSAAWGVASASPLDATRSPSSAQASTIARPPPTSAVMTGTFRLWLLDLDFAGDHGQLGGVALERLPSLRLALQVRGDDLVGQRAARIARRDEPDGGPEMVDGWTLCWRWMRAKPGVELLAIGQFDDEALEPFFIERLARLVEHADAP